VFEELGGRVGGKNGAATELKKSFSGKNSLSVSYLLSLLSACFTHPVIGQRHTKPFVADAKQNDGIRPCYLGVECGKTKGDFLSYRTFPY
jgi:hypothetical protein